MAEPHKPARRTGGVLAPIAAGLLILLKSGKFLTTIASMLFSMVVYALIFGPAYAVGFVLLIFVHEMGHFLAARQRGLAVGAPTFIPFVGAWIQLKEMPHDVETEAYVGIAGPVMGSFGALICYWIGRTNGNDLFLALAYTGFFINLFNLLPLSPLDGGRITAILSPRIWLLGAPILVALFFWRPSPILILIAILSIPSLIRAWRFNPADPANAAYYAASPALRVQYGFLYLVLMGFLAVMMGEVHQSLEYLQAR